ncbi:MAG: DUF721 domain-containing protein [Phycisphaerae bacterium]
MDVRRLERAWLNRQRRQRAEPIGSLAGRVWQAAGRRGGRRLAELRQAWRQVVPAELAGHSQVCGLSRGQLVVTVDAPASRYLIETVLHSRLVAAVNNLMGSLTVRRIRCELGRLEPQEDAG